jgi:hypothetical protein
MILPSFSADAQWPGYERMMDEIEKLRDANTA